MCVGGWGVGWWWGWGGGGGRIDRKLKDFAPLPHICLPLVFPATTQAGRQVGRQAGSHPCPPPTRAGNPHPPRPTPVHARLAPCRRCTRSTDGCNASSLKCQRVLPNEALSGPRPHCTHTTRPADRPGT